MTHRQLVPAWDGDTLTFVEHPKLTQEEMEAFVAANPPSRVRRVPWPDNGATPVEVGTRKVRVVVEQRLFHTVWEQFDTPVFHYPEYEIREWDLPDGEVAAVKTDIAPAAYRPSTESAE